MRFIAYFQRFWGFIAMHWIISTVTVLIIIGGGYWYFSATAKTPQTFIAVTKGPITETVSVTGSTAPIQSVSLAFQNSGTIAQVYHAIGDRVYVGEILAQLNTASLSAALQQAQAAYNSAVASRSSTSLPEAVNEARNVYLSTYTTLDTALHNYVDTLFGGPTVYGPELLINMNVYSYGELSRDRESLDSDMEIYRRSLSSASTTDPVVLLTNVNIVTNKVSDFLNKLAVAVNDTNSQATSAQIAALTSARSSVSALLTTLSNARDTYRSASVGATSLADASVEQAAAGVAVAKANLQGTEIVAPISGVVTQMDAKVGQIASPGTPLVSIMSANSFQVEAGIPETDIGKVMVGNTVSMTLDAFPSETFLGKVFYIDPAETITSGVIDYKIKISFDTADPRMKSGLTTNLDIQTRKKDGVLILPQYAILQNDAGTFIKILKDGVVVEAPVVLGMQDKNGNVEVLSGVTEGEQVLNIGLKQ